MSPSQPRLAKRQDPSGTSAAEPSPTETSGEPTSTPPSSTPAPTSSQPQASSTPSTPTASETPTPTSTPSPTSQTQSQTASQTETLESATPSQSQTPSATASETQISTPSETPTPSQTATATPSQTQSLQSVTPSPSETASQTASQPVSETPTASSTEAQVSQPSQSATSRAQQTSREQSTEIVTITSRQTPTQLPVSTRRADTTAQSSFFVTFTRSDGQVSTSAPSEITSMVATTQPNGEPTTVTQIIAQPTGALNPDGGGRGSSAFFQNKGAVAGVFLIVGIAGAAILAFLFLAYRRRRRYKQNERDAVIAASLGPQSRVPFEDDDDDEPTSNSHGMTQRNPFAYAAGTPHAVGVGQHGEYLGASKGSYEPYDPYATYPVPTASSSGHQHSTAHARVGSGGYDGYEYDYRHYQAPSATGAMPEPRTSPTSPRRAMSPTSGSSQAPTYAPGLGPSIAAAGPSGQNNKRVSGADSASIYSVPEGSFIEGDEDDQRLNSDMLGMRLRGGVGSEGSLRDEEDYSRKVLTVTNAT